MNKLIPAVLIAILFFFFSGCTSVSRNLVFKNQTNSKEIIYIKDKPYLFSEKKHQVILAIINPTLSDNLANLPSFYLQIKNRGPINLDLSLQNIQAESGGKPVVFLSSNDVNKAIERQARARAAGLAFAAGMQKAGAAMQAAAPSYSTTYGSATAYSGNRTPTTVNYTATTTTYNPAATAAAQAQSSMVIDAQMHANMASVMGQKQLAIIANVDIFGRNTVMPQSSAEGRLVFLGKQINENSLKISVNVDGEVHEFDLYVESVNN
jgi:hypothetical protein